MTKKSPEKIVKTLLKLHKDPAAARSFLRSVRTLILTP